LNEVTHQPNMSSDQTQKLMQSWINKIMPEMSKMIKSCMEESLSTTVAMIAISEEAKTDALKTFISTYTQKSLSMAKSLGDIEKTINKANMAQSIKDHVISLVRKNINESLQDMANALSKHYDIDFETLGLEQPAEPQLETPEKK